MKYREIRNDLRDIRYFYSRKELFNKSAEELGKHKIFTTVEKYNKAILQAPPRLYDVYVSIYWLNNSQYSLASKMQYTLEYISMLHTQLIEFFDKTFKKEVN